jgi:hypothetical protein
MKIFEPLMLKFESLKWVNDPELGLIDMVLEEHPELTRILAPDITDGQKDGNFGRQDTPSVEQIVRTAIYKEMKGLDYRTLEYAQEDSRICEQFVKINPDRPYSFLVMQKYISRIREMKALDGVETPDMEITDEEFEAAGGLVRLIGGEIFLGNTGQAGERLQGYP